MAENSGDLSLGYMMGQSENNGGFGGLGDGWLGLILFAMIFGGGWGGGFGGGFGGSGGCGSPCATQADLAAGFNNSAVLSSLNDLKLGQSGYQQALCQGFHGVDMGFNSLSAQLAQCCCDNRAAIGDLKYTISSEFCGLGNAMNSGFRDVIDAQRSGTREILDFLVQDKISTLTAENQSLKFAASQTAQNQFITQVGSDIVNRLQPPPVPAYTVPNPYAGYGYNNSGCGCGCG